MILSLKLWSRLKLNAYYLTIHSLYLSLSLCVHSICINYFTNVETEPKVARGGTISCLNPWVEESYGWCSSCSCCLYRLHWGWNDWVPVGRKRLFLLHGNEHSDPGQIKILFNRLIYLLVEQDVKLSFFVLFSQQVEHPVTEMISSVDLIEEQIRVAMGEKLRYKQVWKKGML